MKNRNNITKNNQNSASFRRINIGEIKHPCMITPYTSEQDTKGNALKYPDVTRYSIPRIRC